MSNRLFEYNHFTAGGTISTRILVFDIDDTLLHSQANIFVRDKDGVKAKLSPSEYNSYELKDGEWFDYTEFRSLDALLDAKMTKYWDTLQREYKKGTHIAILTARAGKEMIKKFFLIKGIDIKDELIFTAGDDDSKLTMPQKKAKCIEQLVKYGYKTLVFFDDNVKNLEAVKSVEKLLNITIHTIQAKD